MITIKNVTKKYGKFTALDKISFELPARGLIVLTGENGCGKTTLLNIISTCETDYTGDVSYNGINYKKKNYKQLRNGVISYVQQDNLFTDYLTINENIEMSGAGGADVASLLCEFGIEEKRNSDPNELSGGQRQKCSFVRGIQRRSTVLLVDEPTNNMDAHSEMLTFQILKLISRDKLVVVVSHNRALVNEYADTIVSMSKGRVDSVLNRSDIGSMQLEGDTVLVPDNDCYNISYDWPEIRKLIAGIGEAKLRFSEKQEAKEKEDDAYRYEELTPVRNRYSKKRTSAIAVKSVFSQPVRNILTSVFISLFVTVLALLLCLSAVNTSQLEYKLLQANGYETVAFGDVRNKSQVHKRVTLDFIYEYEKKYGTEVSFFDSYEQPLELTGVQYGESEIIPEITGVLYTSLEDIPAEDWIIKPEKLSGAVVVTDYIADITINGGMYRSYEEVVSGGIVTENTRLEIDGIVKTDYSRFSYLTGKKTEDTADDADDMLYRIKFYYACLYMDKETVFYDWGNGIAKLSINGGEVFLSVKKLPDDAGIGSSAGYFNMAAAEKYEGLEYIKTKYFAIYLDGTCYDDGSDEAAVYLSEDRYSEMLYTLKERMPWDNILINVPSYEAFEELSVYNMSHDTPISENIDEVLNIVEVTQGSIGFFTLSLMIVTFLFALWLMSDSERRSKFTVFSMIIYGYGKRAVLLFKAVKTAVLSLGVCAVSFVMYFLVSTGLNGILSSVSGYELPIFSDSFAAVSKACGLFLALMLVYVLAGTVRICSKNPMKLYLSILKKK